MTTISKLSAVEGFLRQRDRCDDALEFYLSCNEEDRRKIEEREEFLETLTLAYNRAKRVRAVERGTYLPLIVKLFRKVPFGIRKRYIN